MAAMAAGQYKTSARNKLVPGLYKTAVSNIKT